MLKSLRLKSALALLRRAGKRKVAYHVLGYLLSLETTMVLLTSLSRYGRLNVTALLRHPFAMSAYLWRVLACDLKSTAMLLGCAACLWTFLVNARGCYRSQQRLKRILHDEATWDKLPDPSWPPAPLWESNRKPGEL